MRLIITEEEKKDILDKYKDDTEDKVMVYLKRHYPIIPKRVITGGFGGEFHIENSIMVDDKSYEVEGKKKYLVNKIYYEIQDVFSDLDEKVVRRTIKKYLDIVKTI